MSPGPMLTHSSWPLVATLAKDLGSYRSAERAVAGLCMPASLTIVLSWEKKVTR